MPDARARRPLRPHASTAPGSIGVGARCSTQQRVARRLLGPVRRRRSTASPTIQQAVRWNLFQLAQATARTDGGGVAAKGVTGSGYGGHYFWDTEIYVLPFLSYTSPDRARNALRFRQRMLDAARDRARRAQPARGPVPVAHDQRPGVVRLLRRRHRAVPHRRRHRLRARASTSRPPATTDFLARGASTSWSRPRACGRTSASGATNGDGDVPHPRRHRARRVHDGRQRQPVHERHGAVQPRVAAAAVARAAGDTTRRRIAGCVERARARRRPRSSEWRRAAEAMHIPYDEQLGIHPQDAAVPREGAVGPREHARRPAPAAAALPPARHLPLPGAEAGRRRARALPAGRPVHRREEARRTSSTTTR